MKTNNNFRKESFGQNHSNNLTIKNTNAMKSKINEFQNQTNKCMSKTNFQKLIVLAIALFTAGIVNAQSWSTTGNSGKSVTANFIGTTDNVGLKFKTKNS